MMTPVGDSAESGSTITVRVVVSIDASAFFVVPIGRPGFRQLGEMPPFFRHLKKPRLLRIHCG
jgi:hypothetical protein